MSELKSSLPDVHFGRVSEKQDDSFVPDDSPDDDKELEKTPRDVVELLGFDPKELGSDAG